MARLLETIRCEAGQPKHLKYHQQRVDRSSKALLGTESAIDLAALLTPPSRGLFRCRVVYDHEIQQIEYLPYQKKEIRHLCVIPSEISYSYKFEDRNTLNELLAAHPDADEIIIEQDGMITDTTIANIALYDGKRWVTPKSPLLKGTVRERLIEEGFLLPIDIKSSEINQYEKVALMNAMIGFEQLNPVISYA